jgi:hypothetical protein
LDEQPTAEGSAVTFGELREWLAEHDVDMDHCATVSIGRNVGQGVMLRVEEYATDEQGNRFAVRVEDATKLGSSFAHRMEAAVNVRWLPLKSLPGVGG